MYRKSFVCPYAWTISSTYTISNTKHAVANLNKIYKFWGILCIFTRTRGKQTNFINTFQLFWKVLKIGNFPWNFKVTLWGKRAVKLSIIEKLFKNYWTIDFCTFHSQIYFLRYLTTLIYFLLHPVYMDTQMVLKYFVNDERILAHLNWKDCSLSLTHTQWKICTKDVRFSLNIDCICFEFSTMISMHLVTFSESFVQFR